jgi:hypothetical protein
MDPLTLGMLGLSAYNAYRGGQQAKKGEEQQERAQGMREQEWALGDPLRQKARALAMQGPGERPDLGPLYTDPGNPYATQFRSQLGPVFGAEARKREFTATQPQVAPVKPAPVSAPPRPPRPPGMREDVWQRLQAGFDRRDAAMNGPQLPPPSATNPMGISATGNDGAADPRAHAPPWLRRHMGGSR